jgi:copper oxidase (laccase) domain-containing protein
MRLARLYDGRVGVILTDKTDGNMRGFSQESSVNQKRTLKQLGVTPKQTARVFVGYDRADFTRYFLAERASDFAMFDENGVVSDGILTRQKGLAIFLPLADCLGAVLFDKRKNILMVVHAGRHNLAQNGLTLAVQFMSEQVGSNPADIAAWLSPSAGLANYQRPGFTKQSLQDAAIKQLLAAGVKMSSITASDIDTTTDPNYFSHSQGDQQQRFAIAAVMIK